MVTASNVASANGQPGAVPGRERQRRLACLPTWSMPREKSHGTTTAPRSANGWLDVPVPAARSSTSSPGGVDRADHVVAPAAVLAEESTSLVTS